MILNNVVARKSSVTPELLAKEIFKSILQQDEIVDGVFINNTHKSVFVVSSLPFKAPVAESMLKIQALCTYLEDFFMKEISIIIKYRTACDKVEIYSAQGASIHEITLPDEVASLVLPVMSSITRWRGELNDRGEYRVDLNSPEPGPNYFVNLLLGNRIGYESPLQTTPKSVVDRLGRGSFRSHADTQVLGTRWDFRAEENGFPGNRQFYLLEDHQQIFYSGNPTEKNILEAYCVHSQNSTDIIYKLGCGLEIKRTIFLLPQYEGLPLATEVQSILIRNASGKERNLKMVYTGMFGSPASSAMMIDVIYSTIIMQSSILEREDGSIGAISYDYNPEYARQDIRFHSMMVHHGDQTTYPTEFCAQYNELVGNGTLEKPEGIHKLSSKHSRRGPGFFALAAPISLKANSSATVEHFTGVVSRKLNLDYDSSTFGEEVGRLLDRFSQRGEVEKSLAEVKEFSGRYASFLQISSEDKVFDAYFNYNLPFQVLYQTFVSRSFSHTQKGYREIGFREIQDLFASMYYFIGMDKATFVKELMKEWAGKIFEFGYAYHNFFWVGKEPGKWSDDALWFIQAVERYIHLTNDYAFLRESCSIAGTEPVRSRTIFETMKAIIEYSGKISIGKHHMPLLDHSDWNDCLQLDPDTINGIEKEARYREQIQESGKAGEPLDSEYSESVMNAFLLKYAIDAVKKMAEQSGENAYAKELGILSSSLKENIQKHAWKKDFFVRVLFNREMRDHLQYLGAKGDQCSLSEALDGTYFLNSFSWSVLCNAAAEEQIAIMLETIEKALQTPFGLKLCSPVNFEKISTKVSSAEYFQGDRENGAVFKHANMMATAAMFKAAKEVENRELAKRLAALAYRTIDKTLPYHTLENPYELCGNPRLCTQYNNSETGENIGPELSGTSTWLTLTLLNAFGINFTQNGIELDPILKPEQVELMLTLSISGTTYQIHISKPEGFYRVKDDAVEMGMDDVTAESNVIHVVKDCKFHRINFKFV